MQFRQSAVRRLTCDSACEVSFAIPRDVQPALLGTGEITLALDPLGMQGYNVSIGQYRDTMTLEGHGSLPTYYLHLYRDEAISEHYRRKVYRSTELCSSGIRSFHAGIWNTTYFSMVSATILRAC